MPFRAAFDGQPISARDFDEPKWTLLCARVSDTPEKLQMRCCNATAIPCISPRGRYFFRHRRQPATCDWKPESDEHLDLKAQVADAATSAGWVTEIEHITPKWKADVLVTRGKARIAFEVQLSAQGQSETEMREQRYRADNVLPWWIVNRRNDGNGFGSESRLPLIGNTPEERINAVGADIAQLLGRVESHVDIARAVKAAFLRRNIKSQVTAIGAIPSVFRVESEGKIQPIVIGEIGAGAIGDIETVQEEGEAAPWGAVVQFVRVSDQVRGFGAIAFFLRRSDIHAEVDDIVGKLLAGRLRWIGSERRERVESSYVWYEDVCGRCNKEIVRVPFFIYAHRNYWPKRSHSVFASHTIDIESYDITIGRLGKRLGKAVGSIVKENRSFGQLPKWDEPLSQSCPHCGLVSSSSLVSADEALLWPFSEIDFNLTVPVKLTGWVEPKPPVPRSLPDQAAWRAIQSEARAKRAQELAEKEKKRLAQEEANRVSMEHWHQERERRKAEAAAEEERKAQVLAEKRRLAEEARLARVADERAIRLVEAQEQLLGLALRKCQDRRRVDLWFKNYDPKLRGRPVEMCGDFFEACRKRLGEIKF